MKKIYELHYLSKEFYNAYNYVDYPEIENKKTRPYMVMLVSIENNTYAIPFRTNIRHKYCYKFKNTNRDTKTVTGLDFTKAVIVNDDKYIGELATIDNREYVELNSKCYFIISKFKKYISSYKDYVNGNLNEYEAKKYKYSTLKYFHKQLNIE